MSGIAKSKRGTAVGDGSSINQWLTPYGETAVADQSAQLTQGGALSESVTCTTANVDYHCLNPMPAGTRYVIVSCASLCTVAMGEVTSANRANTGSRLFDPIMFDPSIFDTALLNGYGTGVKVQAGVPQRFAVAPTGSAGADTPHCQSPTGAAGVTFTYLT